MRCNNGAVILAWHQMRTVSGNRAPLRWIVEIIRKWTSTASGSRESHDARLQSALAQDSVVFSVDTNILIEFQKLEFIPWQDVAQNANEITIVVPTKTGEEMDRHKDSGTGRKRRRAQEFQQIIRQIEESNDDRAILKERDPIVAIEFTPVFHRSKLDEKQYDLDDDDGRIVAETAAETVKRPNLILLSDDAKPLRLAQQTNLLALRPPAEWRLQEGPDERDRKIADLERQLGAHPNLSVTFPYGDEKNVHLFEAAPASDAPQWLRDALAEAVLTENPKVSRDTTVRTYGLVSENILSMSLTGSSDGVTVRQLERYDEEYTEFEASITHWADGVAENMRHIGSFLPIHVSITNQGTAIADKVIVELSLTGDFCFMPRSFPGMYLDLESEAPDAPRPSSFLNPLTNFTLPNTNPPKPNYFYRQTEPELDGSTDFLDFRCEEFHHDDCQDLKVVVMQRTESVEGALHVKVRSASLADPIRITAPLRSSDTAIDDHAEYFQRRLDLFSYDLRRAIESAIDQSADDS